jgi:hypothetical protein
LAFVKWDFEKNLSGDPRLLRDIAGDDPQKFATRKIRAFHKNISPVEIIEIPVEYLYTMDRRQRLCGAGLSLLLG